MEEFLVGLEKYELLIELFFTLLSLIIAVISLGLSGYVIWQTNKLAKRQAKQEREIAERQNELIERQIKISLYEQKNNINKAVNKVFDVTHRLIIIIDNFNLKDRSIADIYEILKFYIDEANQDEICYILQESKHVLSKETYNKVGLIEIHFRSLHTFISTFGMLEDKLENDKLSIIDALKESANKIDSLYATINAEMSKELRLI